jgi:hypothetical protein
VDSSIYHNVPIMKQPQTWACWYTSLQMVVKYYRNNGTHPGPIDPSEDPETQQIYQQNQGIGGGPNPATAREWIAKELLFAVLYQSLTAEGRWQLLKSGSVIYAGRWPGLSAGHWVVIVGISENILAINNSAWGLQTWDYNYFMGQYLLQTAERPLIYAP